MPRYIFDIGCNKGYESAHFINAFVPESGITRQQHYQNLESRFPGLGCGHCIDCQEQDDVDVVDASPQRIAVLHIHCYEPAPDMHKVLLGMRSTMASHPRVRWTPHNLAISDKKGIAVFPSGCGELCHLGAVSLNNATVNVTTVDDQMIANNINFIDILKIDTEGYDPAVLQGAQVALRQKRVGIVLFEYNNLNLWFKVPLARVVTDMFDLGYICYFDGKPTLTQLSLCWLDYYELRVSARMAWSNVVCVLRSHYLFPKIHAISFAWQLHHNSSSDVQQSTGGS
jgi:FkbM family methyltransferase